MSSQAFVHKPLSSPRSFRVLELLPSLDFDSTVYCEIREESLDGQVEYEALSYVWGAPTPGFSISVENKTLAVTPNCLEALRYLRLGSRRRVLWIDAICIDQGKSDQGTSERSHQVQLMGEVYSQAQTVLVWFGASDSTTSRTFRRLKLIAMLMVLESRSRELRVFAQLLLKWLSLPMLGTNSDTSRPRYEAITSIIRNKWWRRAWTFQEQALAHRCMALHGRESINLGELMRSLFSGGLLSSRVYRMPEFHMSLLHRYLSDFSTKSAETDRSDQNSTARHILQEAFSLESTLPVDRIYALHALLVSICGLPLPEPDYNKALEDVFEETVWAWILSRQDLSIIQTAARPTKIQNLPSWVPAYHLGHEHFPSDIDGKVLLRPSISFQCFSWESNSHFCDEQYMGLAGVEKFPRTLRVKGRYIAKVTFSRGETRTDAKSGIQKCLDWCQHIHHLKARDPSGHGDALREMFETITFGSRYISGCPDGYDDNISAFRVWFAFLLGRFPWTGGLQTLIEWMQHPLTYMLHKAFCVLDNGMMAMANYWCEVGDEVFLLRGADCPFVLRREGDSYRLVGPAYVHRLYQAQPWRFDGDDVQDITLV
ncbi:hypothetical protein VPNG_01389 [Cytospora leucostoma]|uniref:Heterokaryon incompatibility domain-containing protein n=1 Tax=Cytospora leucostoma TaxID=1230097 RepID=A0A423XLN9_9PEZI|nr:hypothetical protein VPNG_01389 [Cytospora leucostoma]